MTIYVNSEYCSLDLGNENYLLFDFSDLEKVEEAKNKYDLRLLDGYVKFKLENGDFIGMHRYLYGATKGCGIVDHKDGNGLNCQKENLRYVTPQQNSWNTPGRNDPDMKGVSWDRQSINYRVRFRINGRSINGGRFGDPITAAMCANQLMEIHHKNFARFNDIESLRFRLFKGSVK